MLTDDVDEFAPDPLAFVMVLVLFALIGALAWL